MADATTQSSPPARPPRASEHTFVLPDGTELFFRAWLPDAPTDKALLVFHRGHEHSGRFTDVIDELGLTDVAVFAWDARGHGRSPGERGYAPSFATLVKDADCFARHVAQEFSKPLRNMTVLAHSVGAVLAARWVRDYAPPLRAMVLVTPALRVKLYVPLAIPGLRLLRAWKGQKKSYVKSYVKSSMLTRDPEQARRYDDDPLIARAIAVNILLDMYDAATDLMADAGAIRVPTLLLAAGSDWVVRLDAQRRFFRGLATDDKRMRVFDDMNHDLMHERDRGPVLDEIRDFLRAAYQGSAQRAPLVDAHQRGYTKDEYDRLLRPLSLFSPRRAYYAVQRLVMKTVCRLSEGVRLGWRTGFDSGQSLDYVYENRPRGQLILGKAIDRAYLNSAGWRGIRQRKIDLESTLHSVIARLRSQGRPVRILDIATGVGRYVLDTIRADGGEITAVLRDHNADNLAQGRKLAEQLGLSSRVTFQQADAFDEQAIATVQPRPTVAIVSGLYELFPDNDRVLASLRGLAAALGEGGYLVYTGQPWHPQLEMIARVLINRDGRPWIMRRRTQEELDDLVASVGFEKIDMRIDIDGIFTVSLARIGGGTPHRGGTP